MIAAIIASAWLGAAVPTLAEPVRSRRFIVIARKRQKRIETPSAGQDDPPEARAPVITMLRTVPDNMVTFDARWRALHGY